MSLPLVVRAILCNPLGQVLLVQHKKNTPWVLPGGHVETGENPHEAMIREIHEEFDINARFFEIDDEEILFHAGKKLTHYPLPISIYELHYTNKEGKDKSRIEYVFLMETDETIKNIQQEEIFSYQWFDVDDILMMEPNTEVFDFTIQILEKIIGNEENNE